MLKIRTVRHDDKSRVLEIVKDIWEGSDYLPIVFDEWVRDKDGEFAAAVDEENRLIGFEKLTMLTPHDAWIEGLRKDMSLKVKGVGSFITKHLLEVIRRKKIIRTVRFATYYKNIESISLFSKLGFSVLEKRNHLSLRLPNLKRMPEYKRNKAVRGGDPDLIIDFIKRSRWLKKNTNGICFSWVVKPYVEKMITSDFIDNGNVLSISENGKIRALCLYTIREKQDFFISFFEAETPDLFLELLKMAKKTAYGNGQENLCVVLSRKDKNSSLLFKKHNFRSWESEGDFLLFDLPVDRT
ncbi:MAG: GNAT family N-acetyltransferase [Candidatus Delongbacteria bacterium]